MQALKFWIKKTFARWIYRWQINVVRRNAIMNWQQQLALKPVEKLSDASFDIFTYHGEDGIILYLLQKLKNVPTVFIDIGAGDCIKSNCAGLAFHFGWQGVFIDKDEKQLSTGRSFYKKKIADGANIRFVDSEITAENVNKILLETGINKEVGLLSIDIDGNDYWIWKAINVIRPRIVVIEAKVEFGHHDLIVPDSPHNHHLFNKMYNGASVEAFRKLGETKGYKLVGSNKQGYNLFFVKNSENFPGVLTADVLTDPDAIKSFYSASFFAEHKFIKE